MESAADERGWMQISDGQRARLSADAKRLPTAAYHSWSGKSNDELLAFAADAGFDALITKRHEPGIPAELGHRPPAVVVLRPRTNQLADLRALLPTLLTALENLEPNAVSVVE